MAKSTGIFLAAAGITFANEWFQTDKPNFRIVVAGAAGALVLDAIEHVSPELAVGLATIVAITAFFTPINGKTVFDSFTQATKGSASPIASAPKTGVAAIPGATGGASPITKGLQTS